MWLPFAMSNSIVWPVTNAASAASSSPAAPAGKSPMSGACAIAVTEINRAPNVCNLCMRISRELNRSHSQMLRQRHLTPVARSPACLRDWFDPKQTFGLFGSQKNVARKAVGCYRIGGLPHSSRSQMPASGRKRELAEAPGRRERLSSWQSASACLSQDAGVPSKRTSWCVHNLRRSQFGSVAREALRVAAGCRLYRPRSPQLRKGLPTGSLRSVRSRSCPSAFEIVSGKPTSKTPSATDRSWPSTGLLGVPSGKGYCPAHR